MSNHRNTVALAIALAALEEIKQGKGPYKLDRHEHAVSVIENMQHQATQALRQIGEALTDAALPEKETPPHDT